MHFLSRDDAGLWKDEKVVVFRTFLLRFSVCSVFARYQLYVLKELHCSHSVQNRYPFGVDVSELKDPPATLYLPSMALER